MSCSSLYSAPLRSALYYIGFNKWWNIRILDLNPNPENKLANNGHVYTSPLGIILKALFMKFNQEFKRKFHSRIIYRELYFDFLIEFLILMEIFCFYFLWKILLKNIF